MIATLFRIAAQLALIGPLTLAFPIVLLGMGQVLWLLATGDFAGAVWGSFWFAAGLGLTALYLSVFMPLSWLVARRWVKWGITATLAIGIVIAVGFLALNGIEGGAGDELLFTVWTFAGPLLVALWNLWRMFPRTQAQPASVSGGS